MKYGYPDYVIKKTKASHYFIHLPLRIHTLFVFVVKGIENKSFLVKILINVSEVSNFVLFCFS